MPRGAGFANADIDVNIARDPKFRRLARLHPDLIALSFAGYVGMLAESWGTGERKTALDAWPEILPWSAEAVSALQEVGLLDASQKVTTTAWRGWFGAACERRSRRQMAGSIGGKQKASNARSLLEQEASNAVALLPQTPSKILPVSQSVSQSDSPLPPQAGARPRSGRKNGNTPRAQGTSPRQLRDGSAEIDTKALESVAERTARWNETHPKDAIPQPTSADEWIGGGES
jgi:hypothetical protein